MPRTAEVAGRAVSKTSAALFLIASVFISGSRCDGMPIRERRSVTSEGYQVQEQSGKLPKAPCDHYTPGACRNVQLCTMHTYVDWGSWCCLARATAYTTRFPSAVSSLASYCAKQTENRTGDTFLCQARGVDAVRVGPVLSFG